MIFKPKWLQCRVDGTLLRNALTSNLARLLTIFPVAVDSGTYQSALSFLCQIFFSLTFEKLDWKADYTQL